MGARLSTSPLPELADPGRSQPLPPRGAPRGTSPPLRSSQPPVSRKLTPRASSRAARWGCRLRDLHGLGLRKDQHACCYKITTVFSHAQTVVLCVGCSTVLCQPTGGKARLTEGCSFRRKQH
ncbi:ribosomal protein eS27-like isoform X2 [Bos indicus]|uniref:Ribosomal protein eS27-like isoform X2 n=1 Tax=Bos indicus TaxID=9915 RepID=A0ABM4T0H7_BOSIN